LDHASSPENCLGAAPWLALSLSLFLLYSWPARASTAPTDFVPRAAHSFSVVTSSIGGVAVAQQDFAQGVAQTLSESPGSADLIAADLRSLIAAEEEGRDISIPYASTRLGALGELIAALKEARASADGHLPPTSSPAGFAPVDSAPSPAQITPVGPAIDQNDPGGFPVDGAACNDFRSWCFGTYGKSGQFVLGRTVCNNDTCYLADEVTGTATVDPGAVTTKVTGQTYYIVNSGGFSHIHMEAWALCYRSLEDCGNNNSDDNPTKAHPWYVDSVIPLNSPGDHGAWAVALWARENTGGYDGVGARTTLAACGRSDKICTWSS